jgi:hypothetical protein
MEDWRYPIRIPNSRSTENELEAFEVRRDIGAEVVQSLREAEAGKTRVVYSPVIAARHNSDELA